MKLKILKTKPMGLCQKFTYELDGIVKEISLLGVSTEEFPRIIERMIRNERMIGKEVEINP